jgi:hypothetical protein
MSGHLCTFSGKYGDIMWSLPTAKYIAEKFGSGKVDFAVMPYYENLLPLLQQQSYIGKAFVIKEWLRTHSNHGDQPWEAPMSWCPYDAGDPAWYDKIWQLTYRAHPGIGAPAMPLMDFIAWQQNIQFNDWRPVPFLDATAEVEDPPLAVIAYAFNDQYDEQKKIFLNEWLKRMDGYACIDVSSRPWTEAAWVIKESLVYVGCRSACWVLANGLDKETITFEPHPSRHKDCHLGRVFGNPYGKETALPFGMPAHVAAETAAGMIRRKFDQVLCAKTQ